MSGKSTELPYNGEHFDVIIVGAGLAGLTAAVKILQKEPSLNIQILEASDLVGGQISNTPLGEIGGRWITQDQYHIRQLVDYLHIPLRHYVTENANLPRCWDLDNTYSSKLVRYELQRYLNELESNIYYYKPGRRSFNSNTQSMESHICQNLWFNKSRDFMRNVVLLLTGTHATDLSYSQLMSYCYTCGSLQKLIDLWFVWPTNLYEISSAKLIEALLKKLESVKIVHLCQVSEVHQHKDYVDVKATNAQHFRGDVVVLAIPMKNIKQIVIKPTPPKECLVESADGVVILTSFLAEYKEAWWRSAGYSGSFLLSRPLIIGHEYRSTVYAGIMLHEAGQESLVRAIALNALASRFGKGMLLPLKFEQKTYELDSLAHAPITMPFKRIIWSSSSASATVYRGCLGGAVQSGLRAALNAIIALRPQTVSWQDTAEVQRFDNVPKNNTSFLGHWLNRLNLYNTSYYGLITVGSAALLKYGVPKIKAILYDNGST